MWRFLHGNSTDTGWDRLQSSRTTVFTTQGHAKTSVVAKARGLRYKAEMEQKCRSTSELILQQETGMIVASDLEIQYLVSLDRLGIFILTEKSDRVVKMATNFRLALRRFRKTVLVRKEVFFRYESSRLRRWKRNNAVSPCKGLSGWMIHFI